MPLREKCADCCGSLRSTTSLASVMQSGRAAHNCQPQKRPNSRSAPRIVADVVTRLEIRLAPSVQDDFGKSGTFVKVSSEQR
jgi:hypothetical protein